MIVKCRFCDFQRKQDVNLDALEHWATHPDMPLEDMSLITKRMFEGSDSRGYWGVKVHMGKMHKEDHYYQIIPDHLLESHEQAVFDKHAGAS